MATVDLQQDETRDASEIKSVVRVAGPSRVRAINPRRSVVEEREKLQLAQGEEELKRR